MKVSFLGDIALNGCYIDLYRKGLNPFEALEDTLSASDFVVGNLECISVGNKGDNILKKPRLTTTTETLRYLKNINLSIACLANNHIYDHLEDGFSKTIETLKDNNIQYLGASFEQKNVDIPIIIESNGIKIGLLNYVSSDTNPNLPDDAGLHVNLFYFKKVKKDIEILKSSVNHVVLILHWGGRVEGGLYPDWYQPKLAHMLIENGADLIIGNHSHTVQPYEVYKGKYIFYSLGNFCFSDYTSDGVHYELPDRSLISFVLFITFFEKHYNIETKYFKNNCISFQEMNKYHLKIERRNKIFGLIHKNKLLWSMYYFNKQYILQFYLFFTRKDIDFHTKISRLVRYLIKKMK